MGNQALELTVPAYHPPTAATPPAPEAAATPAAAATTQPWQRSWLHCAKGESATLGWIILLHVTAVVGLILLPAPPLAALGVAFGLAFMGGLGTTIAYHRSLAHRSLVLNRVVEQVLVAFAVLNGSGTPASWVAMHRLHHSTSDRDDDISSPHQGGFWWSHLRWLWQADASRAAGMARDLATTRFHFWARAQVPLLALSFFGGLMWPGHGLHALAAALWIGPVRLLYALHVQCTVNSICHLGPVTGEHGSSRNVWWLAFAHMGHGENWHENHHRRPGDARIGKRWQVDIGWWTIAVLRGCRMARLRGDANG